MKRVMVWLSLAVVIATHGISLAAADQTEYRYAYWSQDNGYGLVRIYTVDPHDPAAVLNLTNFTMPYNIPVYSVIPSPDGQWIVVIPGPNNLPNPIIRLLNVATLEMRDIAANLSFTHDDWSATAVRHQRIVWSPDSRYLAFNSYQEESRDTYLYSVAEDSVTNLTSDSASESRLAWSNDNSQLAIAFEDCASYSECTAKIKVLSIPEAIPLSEVIVNQGGGALFDTALCQMSWSPDNQLIAFASICERSLVGSVKEVYIFDPAQQALTRITNYTLTGSVPETSPFLLRAGEYYLAWYDAQTLLIGAAFADSDDKALNFQTAAYHVATSSLSVLSNTEMAQEWAWNSASHQFAFRTTSAPDELQNATIKTARLANDTLEVSQTSDGGCYLSWSPDGRFLGYTNRGIPAGECRESMQDLVFVDTQTGATSFHSVDSNESYESIGWIAVATNANTN